MSTDLMQKPPAEPDIHCKEPRNAKKEFSENEKNPQMHAD
jgi:hypothetical protein